MTTDTLPSIKLLRPEPSAAPRTPTRAERLWEWLTQPHATISAPNERRQARLVAVIALGLMGMFALELLFVPTQARFSPLALPILLTVVGLGLAYALARLRYVNVAATFAMSVVALSVLGQVVNIPPDNLTAPNIISSLQWLALPLLLGGLLLQPRAILFVAVVSVLGILLAAWSDPTVYARNVVGGSIGFVITVAVIVSLVRYVQERYLLRPQLEELQAAAQQLERQNRNLERANREIRDFAYIVAHDLRAPLVNFNGFVNEAEFAYHEMLGILRSASPHLDEAARQKYIRAAEQDMPEALAYLQTNAAQMRSLVDQVLKIARVGKQEPKPQAVDLEAVVKTIMDTFHHQLHERGVEVHLGQLPVIQADPDMLQLVLTNLLDNAIKYAQPGRTARIDIGTQVQPDEVIIHIKDNGRGIDPTDYAKVFRLFRRAGNTADVRGDGFGLPYVQSIVQRQGGRIWFQSALEQGSTFSFSLPQATPQGDTP
jgi:signal transduction histidine kinase